jgi:hypothetical protein
MRRYWLFAYLRYYPNGGLNDFKGSFDSMAECQACFIDKYDDVYKFHIFDSREMEVVAGDDKPSDIYLRNKN